MTPARPLSVPDSQRAELTDIAVALELIAGDIDSLSTAELLWRLSEVRPAGVY